MLSTVMSYQMDYASQNDMLHHEPVTELTNLQTCNIYYVQASAHHK